MTEPHPALRTKGLVKKYEDAPALGPLDLRVKRGELVAMLGPNGAGKSTLLAIAAGLLEASGGTIEVCGEEPGTIAARRLVSFMPDTPALYDDLTISETAEFVARLHGAPDWEDRLEALLARLGLEDRANDLPSQLSRGLRQRASLVLALVRPFELLLLDEPFATLDARSIEVVASVLREQAAQGRAVLLASHQHDALPGDCRCLYLREGTLARDGTLSGTQSWAAGKI
ncbi:MAG TPA: ABC transporter ATP-binding protein [Candidatus Dormibacteraeota bacterium]|jgi:ABC-type multidrug transport system ATPase subunit|nr:ABC transporter ATP-binding protein [Candidatus Dormibacteraeota bacterium]